MDYLFCSIDIFALGTAENLITILRPIYYFFISNIAYLMAHCLNGEEYLDDLVIKAAAMTDIKTNPA